METEVHGFPRPQPALCFFLLLFFLIYLFSYAKVFRRWPHELKPEASSCVISLFHGTPSVLLSTYALISHTHRKPFLDFPSPNTPFRELVIDFSTAYFTIDLLHHLVFLPTQSLFIAHHLATLFVFTTTCHAAGRGGSFLLLLVAAEATSACQNTCPLWPPKGRR